MVTTPDEVRTHRKGPRLPAAPPNGNGHRPRPTPEEYERRKAELRTAYRAVPDLVVTDLLKLARGERDALTRAGIMTAALHILSRQREA